MIDDDSGVQSIERTENVPRYDDLYYLDNGIELQINAIVGKNGTGKSTVYELLYYFIYLFGLKKKIGHDPKPLLVSPIQELQDQHDEIYRDINYLVDRTIEEGALPQYQAHQKKQSYPDYSDLRTALYLIDKHELNLSGQDYEVITDLFKAIKKALADKVIPVMADIKDLKTEEKK